MKLTTKMANTLVEHLVRDISYNINIMNEVGIIIASSDKSRIGEHHAGAIDAIQHDYTNTITPNDPAGSARLGVNMPIHHQHDIIGVVGISGAPEEVSPFARLVVTTTELLVEQLSASLDSQLIQQRRQAFISDWLHNNNLSAEQREDARHLQIDLSRPYAVVVVEISDTQGNLSEDIKQLANYWLISTSNAFVILTTNPASLIDVIQSRHLIYGSGELLTDVSASYLQAKRAFKIHQLLPTLSTGEFQKLQDVDALLNANISVPSVEHSLSRLPDTHSGQILLATLYAFYHFNGDLSDTSQHLHIHRNTLNYRLDKLTEVLGKNPRHVKDSAILYPILLQLTVSQHLPVPVEII